MTWETELRFLSLQIVVTASSKGRIRRLTSILGWGGHPSLQTGDWFCRCLAIPGTRAPLDWQSEIDGGKYPSDVSRSYTLRLFG